MKIEQLEEINNQLLNRIRQLETQLDTAESTLREAGYYLYQGKWSATD